MPGQSPATLTCLNRGLNSVAAKDYAAGTAFLRQRCESLRPTRREQRFNKAPRCDRELRSVTEPPGFRDAGQPVHINIFYLNHFEQSKPGVRASPAAGAGSAVWSFTDAVITGHIIDHHRAGTNARCDLAPATRIAGPHTGTEAERRIIRKRNSFVGRGHDLNRKHWAEGFFAHKLHGVVHARNDRGLEEIRAQVGTARATGQDFGAAFNGVAQLLLDCFELAQADHGADFNTRVGRRTNAKLFRFFDAEMNEAVSNSSFNVYAFDREAGLATIGEAAPDGRARRGT